MKRVHKRKLESYKRYKAVVRLNHLIEEKEILGDEQEVIGKEYLYDCLELPYRAEFDQLRETDEEGNVISEDYIESNYESLLEEARELYNNNLRQQYIAEARKLRYEEIESTYQANEVFDTMNAERSVNLLRNAVSDFEEGERVKWINLKSASVEVTESNADKFKELSKEVSRNLQSSYDKLDIAIYKIMTTVDTELESFNVGQMWKEI